MQTRFHDIKKETKKEVQTTTTSTGERNDEKDTTHIKNTRSPAVELHQSSTINYRQLSPRPSRLHAAKLDGFHQPPDQGKPAHR